MQTSLTNLRRRNLSWNTHSSEYPALFLPPRTSSTLVRPSKYLVLITSYQISNFLQSTKQVSSLHLSPLDSARGEKVAKREACSIVVRQHYSRSRYARGVEPSFKRPPSIRRQHRYDYVSNGRSVGRNTIRRGISPDANQFLLFHDDGREGVPPLNDAAST